MKFFFAIAIGLLWGRAQAQDSQNCMLRAADVVHQQVETNAGHTSATVLSFESGTIQPLSSASQNIKVIFHYAKINADASNSPVSMGGVAELNPQTCQIVSFTSMSLYGAP
jgi:hypothetical protein